MSENPSPEGEVVVFTQLPVLPFFVKPVPFYRACLPKIVNLQYEKPIHN